MEKEKRGPRTKIKFFREAELSTNKLSKDGNSLCVRITKTDMKKHKLDFGMRAFCILVIVANMKTKRTRQVNLPISTIRKSGNAGVLRIPGYVANRFRLDDGMQVLPILIIRNVLMTNEIEHDTVLIVMDNKVTKMKKSEFIQMKYDYDSRPTF